MSRKQPKRRKKKHTQPRRDTHYQRWAPLLEHLTPAPVAPDAQCPDCGACFDHVAQEMVHADGCPIQSDYEAASEADRQWFREHPGATVRRRTPTLGEIQQQMLMASIELPDFNTDVSYEPGGEVVVNYLSDGVRMRDFSGSFLVANVAP